MGGGASSNAYLVVSELNDDVKKPADASDITNFEECKKELIAIRAKVRKAMEIKDAEKLFKDEGQEKLDGAIDNLIKSAHTVESIITTFLQGVASACGGTLEGLQYRFKDRTSLERKIKSNIEAKARLHSKGKGQPPDEIAIVKAVHDALRYTMLVPESEYTNVVKETRKKLLETGHKKAKFKNYWGPGIYIIHYNII
jgi:hypothetical protein